MICKCGTPGKLNTILNKDFYFCPTCRDEIKLEVVGSLPADMSRSQAKCDHTYVPISGTNLVTCLGCGVCDFSPQDANVVPPDTGVTLSAQLEFEFLEKFYGIKL